MFGKGLRICMENILKDVLNTFIYICFFLFFTYNLLLFKDKLFILLVWNINYFMSRYINNIIPQKCIDIN